MRIRNTLIKVICSGVMLGTVADAMPALGVAVPAASDSYQTRIDCKEWQQRHRATDSTGNPCASQPAVRTEEKLRDLSRADEQDGLRWQPLEPAGRDLSLWYYPGAPRPLWGY